MPKSKEITNEDLARMVKRGFDSVDKRFDGVDKRFKAVDKRFDGVDNRLGNLEKRMDILGRGQEEIKLRLGNVVHRFELEALKKRMDRLEMKLSSK